MKHQYIAGLLLAAAAFTAPALASERIPANASVVSQKSTFLERLVTNSIASRTITEEGDDLAKSRLAEARLLVDEAKDLLAQEDFEAADKKLDAALALVNGETRRLSVAGVKFEREKEAYDRRRHTVDVFLAAYQRVNESEHDASAGTQFTLIQKLVAEADSLALNNDYKKGLAILDNAYELARADIREAREGQTLTRSLIFETPRDAYEYELGRSRSHMLLLQFAIEEKNPQGSMLEEINVRRKEGEKIRAEAIKKAEAGAYVEAINDLERASEMFLKGIRMSGIFIPG